MAGLNGKMANLRIWHDEAVADVKESREKLLALIEHTRKDPEEAQKLRNEHDELLRASRQF
jgi:hypothetical protein